MSSLAAIERYKKYDILKKNRQLKKKEISKTKCELHILHSMQTDDNTALLCTDASSMIVKSKLKPIEIYEDAEGSMTEFNLPEFWPEPRNQSARIFIASDSGTRKTTWVSNLLTQKPSGGLKNNYTLCVIVTDHVHNYSDEVTQEFKRLRNKYKHRPDSVFMILTPAQYKQANITPSWFNKTNSRGETNHNVLIVDDGHVPAKHLSGYLTQGRNLNMTLVLITQDIFDNKNNILTVSAKSNFNVFVLGRLTRPIHMLTNFLEQYISLKEGKKNKTFLMSY